MVVGKDADLAEVSRQNIIFFKEFAGGYCAAVSAGFLENQKLRDKGFKAGEMIKQENIALQHLRVGIQFKLNAKHMFDGTEQFYGTIIQPGIDIGPVFLISRLFHKALLFQRSKFGDNGG